MNSLYLFLIFESLVSQHQDLYQQLSEVSRRPTEKNIHELRITLRKIRSALWVLKSVKSITRLSPLAAELKKLGHLLGYQREMNVALRDARRYHLKTKKLRADIQKNERKIQEHLSSRKCQKIEKLMSEVLQQMQNHQSALSHIKFKSKLERKIKPWIRLNDLDPKQFHELRKTVKKARYVLEAIGRPEWGLRDLQKVLGRGHDLLVLQKLVSSKKSIRQEMSQQFQKGQKMKGPTLTATLKSLDQI